METKSKSIIIAVTSQKFHKGTTLVVGSIKNTKPKSIHISKLMAQSAERELNIDKCDKLVFANPAFIEQGYKLYIS